MASLQVHLGGLLNKLVAGALNCTAEIKLVVIELELNSITKGDLPVASSPCSTWYPGGLYPRLIQWPTVALVLSAAVGVGVIPLLGCRSWEFLDRSWSGRELCFYPAGDGGVLVSGDPGLVVEWEWVHSIRLVRFSRL